VVVCDILFFIELDPFVDGFEEYEDGEPEKPDEYASNFEEIFVDLEVVDVFDKLCDFVAVVAELLIAVGLVENDLLDFAAHRTSNTCSYVIISRATQN